MSDIVLGNDALELVFDGDTPSLRAVDNRLAEQRYSIVDRGFVVQTSEGAVSRREATLVGHERSDRSLDIHYQAGGLTIQQTWTLGADDHFAEVGLTVESAEAWQWLHVTCAQLEFDRRAVALMRYAYQKNVTFFGRTSGGGCALGVEMPFDASRLTDTGVQLGHAVNMPVAAGQTMSSEPVYLGAYRCPVDEPSPENLPRPAESEAMLAMVSSVLGPPRHGFVSVALGWHSEMTRETYDDDEVTADLRALDLIADCGIDLVEDSHPWGGQYRQLNDLIDPADFRTEPRTRTFLDRARQRGLGVALWTTLNHTHPWRRDDGRPFRSDRPDWIMTPGGMLHRETLPDGTVQTTRNVEVNCLANQPFFDWLVALNERLLRDGDYASWYPDGHFIGLPYGGRFLIPATCPSEAHDHLPGDNNYACLQRMRELVAAVRRCQPGIFLQQFRPVMDLGVWTCWETDGLFTIHESSQLDLLPGLTGQSAHMILGDKIRTWSRVRRQHHFLPHYLDMSLLFPLPASEGYPQARDWSGVDLDYILLSALSSSPKLMMNLPARSGMPPADRATIRHWLEWGRDHERYLMVRHDLPDWPGAGAVDGTMHIIDGEGYIFLFNPNDEPLPAMVGLSRAIMDSDAAQFELQPIRPASDPPVTGALGETVRWTVPPRSAALLHARPLGYTPA